MISSSLVILIAMVAIPVGIFISPRRASWTFPMRITMCHCHWTPWSRSNLFLLAVIAEEFNTTQNTMYYYVTYTIEEAKIKVHPNNTPFHIIATIYYYQDPIFCLTVPLPIKTISVKISIQNDNLKYSHRPTCQ